jgi:ATP adenylyltransferase
MERKVLLAPWRMSYLEGPKLTGCFLCKGFTDPDVEANLVLVKSSHSGIVLNRYPYITGHLMVFPSRHVSSFAELHSDELNDLARWIRASEIVLRKVYNPDGFNIGVNLGSAGGAGLKDHLHVHVLPRWNGDTNFMTTCADIRVVPETLDCTFKRLMPLYQAMKDSGIE